MLVELCKGIVSTVSLMIPSHFPGVGLYAAICCELGGGSKALLYHRGPEVTRKLLQRPWQSWIKSLTWPISHLSSKRCEGKSLGLLYWRTSSSMMFKERSRSSLK